MGTYAQVILPLKLDWIPFYRIPAGCAEVVPGDKVKVNFAGRNYIGVVSNIADSLPEGLSETKVRDITSVESQLVRISKENLTLWKQIADYYLCTVGEVYKTAYPASKIDQEAVKARIQARKEKKIATLKEKIEKARQERTRERYKAELEACLRGETEEELEAPGAVELSDHQRRAYYEIKEAFENNKPVLLNGITGSGKTEIYEKLALEVLRKKNVLYLVPEIALSRQLEERLSGVFGERLMVFHSHETVASRGDVASRIASHGNGNYIVLGTRSALFLPHHDLGLIIIDEEHDNSYKQDSPAPRYNGRDVCVMMAAAHKGCSIILGSATPSFESLYNCSIGKFTEVKLSERYHGAADSEVMIIDTISERKKRGMMGSFSYKLIQEVNQALEEGGQVMILRSRRSYSPVLQCSECGDIPRCTRCNIPLSLHAGPTEKLVCHHCGWTYQYNGKCEKCGGELIGLGAGTQKIEEEAEKIWPDVRVARLDSDVTTDKKAEQEIVKGFEKGEIKILIGTQIVSKGFDFGGVSLVAVLQADSLLGIQDFRADEKAYQLMEQFRGRCGRRDRSGKFIIQTANPEHPVYKHYLPEEGEAPVDLYAQLLEERKDFNYPPFCRVIEISLIDDNGNRAEKMMRGVVSAINMAIPICISNGSAFIDGPFKNKLTVSLAKDRNLSDNKHRIASALKAFEATYKYDGHIVIDVDPS